MTPKTLFSAGLTLAALGLACALCPSRLVAVMGLIFLLLAILCAAGIMAMTRNVAVNTQIVAQTKTAMTILWVAVVVMAVASVVLLFSDNHYQRYSQPTLIFALAIMLLGQQRVQGKFS